MENKRMPSVVEQVRGVSYKPIDLHTSLDKDSITLLRANNIEDGKIIFSDVVFVDRKCVSTNQILKKGDILICASSGSRNLVGKAASFSGDGEYTFGAFCKVVRPHYLEDADYIAMYFQSPIYRRLISEAAQGININNIRNEHIDALTVKWGSNDMRRQIVERLQTLKIIIQQRHEQLNILDQLIKARFVEMFVGKGHPMIALDDLSLGKGEYGAQSASVEYDPKRPRYVRITDINDDGTLNDDVVSSANIEDDEQYILTYGDFMFARMGATVGKTYAYKTGNQIFAGYLIRYRLNLSIITPEYLFAYT